MRLQSHSFGVLSALIFLQGAMFFSTSAVAQPGTMKWSFATGGDIVGSPAIGPENVIYAGSRDRNLYAINPDGTEKWRFETAGQVLRPPVVAEDGTIYAVDNMGNLYALGPDGSLKWTFVPPAAGPGSEIALAEDGTIYFGVVGSLYAVNPDGSQFWSSEIASYNISGVSIGADGVVLVTAGNGGLAAMNPLTGAELWKFQTDFGGSQIGPAVAEDGSVYFGVLSFPGNNFYAVNPDGTLKWKVPLDAQIDAGPSLALNGDIYVPINFKVTQGMNKGFILCLDPVDGSEKWRYETDGGVGTVPAVGLDGTIYFANTSGKLVALRPDGTLLWAFAPTTVASLNFNSSPTIAENGTVYYGSTNDNVYAVFSDSAGPTASAWPMARLDIRNTGRLGSDVSRLRWFAPHVYWLDEANNAVVIISHIGERVDPAGRHFSQPAGEIGATTASFRVDVLNRDGSVFFSIDDSVEPGETKEFVLAAPGNAVYQGSVIIDAPLKDGLFLAPFLTWNLDVSAQLEPLAIGAFFSDSTEAAQLHYFPAEASATNGLGIGVQNIGENAISCLLELFDADGTPAAEEVIDLNPRGSLVDFFTDLVLSGGGSSLQGSAPSFKGRGAFTCDAPVIAIAVNQDFGNGGFPTDRLTIKGLR